jgi:predicted peroxiredoxin
MKKILLLAFLISLNINAQEKKDYFIHLTSDPMKNPSAAMMSIAAASEALKQNHSVVFFAAGDGTKILIKDVINNLHTVTSLGRGVSGDSNKISQMLKKAIIEFSNNGGVIHISEGSILTYGVTQKNYKEHLIAVKKINWSYPKELIQESSKADIVFSY